MNAIRCHGFRSRLIELALYAAGPAAIFLTAPVLARGLGPVGRGEFGVAQSVAALALAIGSVGQAEVYLADRREGEGHYRSASIVAVTGSAVVSVLAFATLSALGIPALTAACAVVLLPILSQAQLWRSVAISAGSVDRPAIFSAGSALLRVVLLLVLAIFSLVSSASAILAVQLASSLAAIGVLGPFAYKSRRAEPVDRAGVSDTFVKGVPMLGFGLLTSVTLNSDIIVLQLTARPDAVGTYSAVAALCLSGLAVSGAFKSRMQVALFDSRSTDRFRTELAILGMSLLLAVTITMLLADPIVELLFGAEFHGAGRLLRVLSVAAGGLVLLDVAHGGLIALGRRRLLLYVAGVGAATRLATLAILVPPLGTLGAAIASACTFWVAAGIGLVLVWRALPQPADP